MMTDAGDVGHEGHIACKHPCRGGYPACPTLFTQVGQVVITIRTCMLQ